LSIAGPGMAAAFLLFWFPFLPLGWHFGLSLMYGIVHVVSTSCQPLTAIPML
jgi:hypothetical protein